MHSEIGNIIFQNIQLCFSGFANYLPARQGKQSAARSFIAGSRDLGKARKSFYIKFMHIYFK